MKYKITKQIIAAIINAESKVYPDELKVHNLVKLTTPLRTIDRSIMPKGTVMEITKIIRDKDGYSYIIWLENDLDNKRIRLVYPYDEQFEHIVV